MKYIISYCLLVLLICSTAFSTMPASNIILAKETQQSNTDSQWPMESYDAQHTGSSPYTSKDNPGGERWKFFLGQRTAGSNTPIIDTEGIIYAANNWRDLYALYPNGTVKWSHHYPDSFQLSNPALDANQTLYVATKNQLDAFYLNGTIKWSIPLSGNPYAQTIVGPDGSIFTAADNRLYTVSPNGTLIRSYTIPNVINGISVDLQGNIYLSGWQNDYVYSFTPDGNLRWELETTYVFDALTIGKDGTVYFHSNTYVYALDQNGQFKWISDVDLDGRSPSIAPDGTLIETSIRGSRIVGLDPSNGLYRWEYDVGDSTRYMTGASIDCDGTIYFAATDEYTAYLYSLSASGTLKWKTKLTCDFPYSSVDVWSNPAISSDGTVYVTTMYDSGDVFGGYVHAIGAGTIQNIKEGFLYFRGEEIIKTLKGRTIILGAFTLNMTFYHPEQVMKVEVLIDNQTYHILEQPPFECRFNTKLIGSHQLEVRGYYVDKVISKEKMSILFLISGRNH